MKLWFVVTIAGNVAATWGPLPYDAAECEVRRLNREIALDHEFAANGGVLPVEGPLITRSDIVTKCVQSETRPE